MNYKFVIKELVPPILLKAFREVKNINKKKPDKYHCPVCKNEVDCFLRLSDWFFEKMDQYQNVHPIFLAETINFLKYSCPSCECSDRDRLYALYLNKFFSEKTGVKTKYKFLDVAPAKSLSLFLRNNQAIDYRSVDLYNKAADDQADITNLTLYEDNKFDILLCSHVLEHVVEDRKAMAELHRILKLGGFGIIMVPILLSLSEDLENPEWTSEADKWKYYGQDDHVRMYSKSGFVNKLTQSGFKVKQLGVEYFGEGLFQKNGIHRRSILYIVEK
jgi:predicted SAM-dependent methyltransferase